MKKPMALLLAIIMAVALTACSANIRSSKVTAPTINDIHNLATGEGKTVGICMPNDGLYWANGAQILKTSLEERQYTVTVCYAQNEIAQQVSQLKQFVDDRVDCLVVAPIDSVVLVELEESAEKAGIPIIAYDRLLMDTNAVDAMVTFDYTGIGAVMAQHIVQAKQLQTAAKEKRSYTIEFFMGSADDNCAVLLHGGVLSVLQQYLDSGVLKCKTGRTSFEDTYIQRWSADTAQNKCLDYLGNAYKNQTLDIVCAASDELAAGVIRALEKKGYSGSKWPLITGQGGALEAVKNVLSGKQIMTVYKDTATMAKKCADIVHALVFGQPPEVNDTASGNNHVIVVPAYVAKAVPVDINNYTEVLVKTGIYEEKQLAG